MVRLSRIRVYPLKGAAGYDLEEAAPDAFGLPWDRRWMLTDPRGGFLSQRTHPRLAVIRVDPDGAQGDFRVRAPGMEPLGLFPVPDPAGWLTVRVHRDTLELPRGSREAAAWFSRFLGTPCELVFIPGEVRRPVDPDYAPGHRVGLADAYPVLLAAEESLGDLNRRASASYSMLRFRPNLVVQGGGAWEEDRWRSLDVGSARLALVKPCDRCSVTTVDPDSGARGREPLQALSAFRRWEGKSYFGQNVVFAKSGSFRVGDVVHIVEEGDPRPPLPW